MALLINVKNRNIYGWGSNLVLFGIPEGGLILQAKKTVDEVFDFVTGKQVQIKDIFHLRWFNKSGSPSCPCPLLIKLCTAWDRKLILMRRFMLKDFHLKCLYNLFVKV